MKATILLLVLGACLVAVGCKGPVEEVKAFLNEKDDLLAQIAKKLETNPSEAGVDEARKLFEAKKGDLKAKSDDLKQKHLEKYGDLTSMMLEDAVNEGKILMQISAEFSLACPKAHSYEQCEPAQKKLSALEKDFKDAF
jgi:hypothetical protein